MPGKPQQEALPFKAFMPDKPQQKALLFKAFMPGKPPARANNPIKTKEL